MNTTKSELWRNLMPPIPWSKTFYGNRIFFNVRDCSYLMRQNTCQIEKSERFSQILNGTTGLIWDVGCNVGIFSLLAASKEFRVVAFDISPKAITHLLVGAAYNHLLVETVCRAFSVASHRYHPPSTASPQNQPTMGKSFSLSYLEATSRYGVPSLIKMDIEGGEREFLLDAGFKQWIISNRITFLVEMHGLMPVWLDVPHVVSSENHILYNPTPRQREFIRVNNNVKKNQT